MNRTYSGLKSGGDLCYMNSVLQTLYMTPEFRSLIYNTPKDFGSSDTVIPSLKNLFSRLQLLNSDWERPLDLILSLERNPDSCSRGQDITEFYREFLSTLDDRIEGVFDLFQGTIRNSIQCSECLIQSPSEEAFIDILLAIKSESAFHCNISEALSVYFGEERLTGNNMYYCNYCREKTEGIRRSQITKEPYILVLNLKRFEDSHKLCDRVEFPMKLSLTSSFELYAILVHSGRNLQVGHYHAYIKDFKSGDWMDFNDEKVSLISLTQIEQAYGGIGTQTTAYVLFYRKIDLAANINCIEDEEVPFSFEELVAYREKLERIELKIHYKNTVSVFEANLSSTVSEFLSDVVEAMSIQEDVRFHYFKQGCVLKRLSSDRPIEGMKLDRGSSLILEPINQKNALTNPVYTVLVHAMNSELLELDDPFEMLTRTPREIDIENPGDLGQFMELLGQEYQIPTNELIIHTKDEVEITWADRNIMFKELFKQFAIIYVESVHNNRWKELFNLNRCKVKVSFELDREEIHDEVFIYPSQTINDLKQKISEKMQISPLNFDMVYGVFGTKLQNMNMKIRNFQQNCTQKNVKIILLSDDQEYEFHYGQSCPLKTNINPHLPIRFVKDKLINHLNLNTEHYKISLHPREDASSRDTPPIKNSLHESEHLSFSIQEIEDSSQYEFTPEEIAMNIRFYDIQEEAISDNKVIIVQKQIHLHDLGSVISKEYDIPHNQLVLSRYNDGAWRIYEQVWTFYNMTPLHQSSLYSKRSIVARLKEDSASG